MLSLRAGISTPLGERPRMPEAEPTPELLVSLELTTDGDHHSGEGDRHSGDGDHHSGAPPQSGRLQIGISGRLRSESVVAFDWNGWSASTGICSGGLAGREVAAAYPYRDAGGRLLYEVVRRHPKSFACRRPDGAGGWVWNLDGSERVLYRLPELVAAVRDGLTVFVVEGEKDADALARLGLAATTNVGGAGKWRAEYAGALGG